MTERVQKAIDIFLDAINNGTLAKGTCQACAVGNLVAHGKGGIIRCFNYAGRIRFACDIDNEEWGNAFVTMDGQQKTWPKYFDNPKVIESVQATDFTMNELMQIEYAFECNTKISHFYYNESSPEAIRKDQINGLAAVVRIMLSFDSTEPVENSLVHEVFISKAELIPIK
jgi:hypothetical protein